MPYDIFEKRNSQLVCSCQTIKQAMRIVESLTPSGLKRDKWSFEWKLVTRPTYRDPPYIPKKKDMERLSEDSV